MLEPLFLQGPPVVPTIYHSILATFLDLFLHPLDSDTLYSWAATSKEHLPMLYDRQVVKKLTLTHPLTRTNRLAYAILLQERTRHLSLRAQDLLDYAEEGDFIFSTLADECPRIRSFTVERAPKRIVKRRHMGGQRHILSDNYVIDWMNFFFWSQLRLPRQITELRIGNAEDSRIAPLFNQSLLKLKKICIKGLKITDRTFAKIALAAPNLTFLSGKDTKIFYVTPTDWKITTAICESRMYYLTNLHVPKLPHSVRYENWEARLPRLTHLVVQKLPLPEHWRTSLRQFDNLRVLEVRETDHSSLYSFKKSVRKWNVLSTAIPQKALPLQALFFAVVCDSVKYDFIDYITACPNLRVVYLLATCQDNYFERLTLVCKKVSCFLARSTSITLHSIQHVCHFLDLTHLVIATTYAAPHDLTKIFASCQRIRHLDVLGCLRIESSQDPFPFTSSSLISLAVSPSVYMPEIWKYLHTNFPAMTRFTTKALDLIGGDPFHKFLRDAPCDFKLTLLSTTILQDRITHTGLNNRESSLVASLITLRKSVPRLRIYVMPQSRTSVVLHGRSYRKIELVPDHKSFVVRRLE